jgi:hypothetical protein
MKTVDQLKSLRTLRQMKPVITPCRVRHALQMRLMHPDRHILKRRKHLDEHPASHGHREGTKA